MPTTKKTKKVSATKKRVASPVRGGKLPRKKEAPEHKHTHGDDARGHHHIDIRGLLQTAGLKVTLPRQAILEVLRDKHGPFTAEELRKIIGATAGLEQCDLVTIYRCLAKFESSGLISRCDFGDGSVRYELQSAGHHHHIICRNCRRVEPLAVCPVDDKSIRMPDMGFREVTHRLEFFGICPDCQG